MHQELPHDIEAAVDRYLATAPDAPAACVAIDAPAGAFTVTRGLADPATDEAMTADHAVQVLGPRAERAQTDTTATLHDRLALTRFAIRAGLIEP